MKRAVLAGLALTAMSLPSLAHAEEKITIAALPAQVGIPFYTSVRCGAFAAAKQYDVDLNWAGPTTWDIAAQQPFIDAALQLKPQGIVLSPTDGGALISQVQKLESAGTPVITIDAPLDKPVELQSIQSNHYLGGVAAGKAMAEVAGGEGTFVAVGMRPGMPDIGARVAGFIDTFKKANPHAVLLPTLYPGDSSTMAAQQISAVLQANPDLKGVYVTHSAAAEGAAAAILEAGDRGKVKVVAFDADPQQIRDLRDGIYDALIAQEPYQMGFDAVKDLAQVIRGQVKASDVKHDHFLPFAVITRSNLKDPATQAYIYKTSCK